jgi:hypothetical protein
MPEPSLVVEGLPPAFTGSKQCLVQQLSIQQIHL